MAAIGVRRDKAALSSGCNPHPANAPAGRFYGSSQGGREPFRVEVGLVGVDRPGGTGDAPGEDDQGCSGGPVSYTHLRAHETPEHLVCRLLLEKKKKHTPPTTRPRLSNTQRDRRLQKPATMHPR